MQCEQNHYRKMNGNLTNGRGGQAGARFARDAQSRNKIIKSASNKWMDAVSCYAAVSTFTFADDDD